MQHLKGVHVHPISDCSKRLTSKGSGKAMGKAVVGIVPFPPYANFCSDYATCESPGTDVSFMIRVLHLFHYYDIHYVVEFFEANKTWSDTTSKGDTIDTWAIPLPSDKINEATLEATDSIVDFQTVSYIHHSNLNYASSSGLLAKIIDYRLGLGFIFCFGLIRLLVIGFERCLPVELIFPRVAHTAWWLVVGLTFGVYSNFLSNSLAVPLPPSDPFPTWEALWEQLTIGRVLASQLPRRDYNQRPPAVRPSEK